MTSIERVLDVPRMRRDAADLEEQAGVPNLWDDPEKAQAISREYASLREDVDLLASLEARLSDAEVARQIEVPPWKVKDLARQSRMWSATAVSSAIRRVARADADVKGAASDAEFALEQMVLDVIAIGEAG